MQKLAFLVASASLFAIAPIASRFGSVGSSVALVWLSVLVAVVASGLLDSLAVTGGAIGAFAAGLLGTEAPAAAGAVLVALAFAERTLRVRTRQGQALHVLLALVSGAIAGSLSQAFAAASPQIYTVAVLVSAMLTAAPLLIAADDPVAHALEGASGQVTGPVRDVLEQGAELRRQAVLVAVEHEDEARLRSTWSSLLRLAEARVRLERSRGPSVAPTTPVDAAPKDAAVDAGAPTKPPAPTTKDAVLGMVDDRIKDHVLALERAYSAVDTAHAAKAGIDDTAQKEASSMGDSLDEVSRALVEVRSDSSAS